MDLSCRSLCHTTVLNNYFDKLNKTNQTIVTAFTMINYCFRSARFLNKRIVFKTYCFIL